MISNVRDADHSTRKPDLRSGETLGPYEVLEIVGSGRTGTVYRAWDPRLNRPVALKLVDAGVADEAAPAQIQARLLSEAQTLAQLAHPNVVAAYDVGTHEGRVFFVMELTDGESLHEWLSRPHTTAEILRVLIGAGRGLAAAHAAGVVHRDFKPANVMVSRDGRVRVVDFGLARAVGVQRVEGATGHGASRDAVEGARRRGAEGVTATAGDDREATYSEVSELGWASKTLPGSDGTSRASTVLGTPGYIAPELMRGRVADSRSDQFSFAATLFVALVGRQPFPEALDEFCAAIDTRQRPVWPRAVPRRIRSIVGRGLALAPEDRHPSVVEMVTALEGEVSPVRRLRLALGIAGVAAASVMVPLLMPGERAGAVACNMDDAAFRDIWNEDEQRALEQAFLATGRSNAGEAFGLVAERLNRFRSQWLGMRRDSCDATHVRGTQDERTMALRAACLDRALEATKALISALAQVQPTTIDKIAGAFPPSVDACSDVSSLASPDSLPDNPELRGKINQVEVDIAVNQTLIAARHGTASIAQAQRILELAHSTEHATTIAAATAQLGRASWAAAGTNEQRSAAEALLADGIRLAAAARDDVLLARTSCHLFYLITYGQRRIREGEAMLPTVEALVARIGGRPEQRVELLMGKASIAGQHLRYDEALQILDEARRIAPEVDSEIRAYGIYAAVEQAFIYTELRKHDEAIAAHRSAVDGLSSVYGPGHPRVLYALLNLARGQSAAGQRDLALESVARARRLAANLPPDEPRLKFLPEIEGEVWQNSNDCSRAVPFFREALERFIASGSSEQPRTAQLMTFLGNCLADIGEVDEAVTMLDRALQSRRRSGTPTAIGESAFALAKVLWQLPAQRARAVALLDEAQALWKQDGASEPDAERWIAERRGK
jgi:serine/threonine protein kinase/tetratricopeptide (TPR) repeat protein